MFGAQFFTRDETVIISIKIQTESNKDATVQTLPFLTDETQFHGPPPRLCGLDCGFEHMPNMKLAGEKPFCVCVLDLALFHLLYWIGRKAAASSLLCKCSRQAAEGMLQLWFDVMLSEIPALPTATLPTLHISLLAPLLCWCSCCSRKPTWQK